MRADPPSIPDTREVTRQLESVRRLLIESPGAFSVVAAGAALESVTQGLIALQRALEREAHQPVGVRAEVTEVLALSGRVQALYRQAASFYGTLAGPQAPSAYTPTGEFHSESPQSGRNLKAEG